MRSSPHRFCGVLPSTDGVAPVTLSGGMGPADQDDERHVRCTRCGDVIGIYEPVIVVDGAPRETSRAAEPDLHAVRGAAYHRGCYRAGDLTAID